MANDMLVKLYDIDELQHMKKMEKLARSGIQIKRALPIDKQNILQFVQHYFTENWVNECEAALLRFPVSCFIAVRDKEIIGFSCYDATAKGYFGPIGVLKDSRGTGIGEALTKSCLLAMREEGYGYAIIGWVEDAIPFYEKTVNAKVIENSFPGVYSRLVDK